MNALEKMFSLEGKTVIVTGGAQGIGKVAATRMAEVGADIVIFDMQEEKAKETAAQIAETTGKKVIAYGVDVTDPTQVKAAIEKADADMGGLDHLFNNAGIVLLHGFRVRKILKRQGEERCDLQHGVYVRAYRELAAGAGFLQCI